MVESHNKSGSDPSNFLFDEISSPGQEAEKNTRQREELQRSGRSQTQTMLTLLSIKFNIARGAAESLFLHVDVQKVPALPVV